MSALHMSACTSLPRASGLMSALKWYTDQVHNITPQIGSIVKPQMCYIRATKPRTSSKITETKDTTFLGP